MTDSRVLVHTPAELGTEFVQWAEDIQSCPGVPFGVPAMDKRVIPMRPGTLTCFVARPGGGKTSMMAYLAKSEAKRIVERGKQEEEAVVYVTWEQSAEELEAFFQCDDKVSISDVAWGRVKLDDVRKRSVKRAQNPIWVIGHSISRAGQPMPRMTTDVVLDAIGSMKKDFGVKPTLMLFDYLQIIPVDHARDRIQQVSEATIRIKELALRIGAPAVAGVQAKREVDYKTHKIPGVADCQWSSGIEQTSDKMFGLWRPITTNNENDLIEIAGRSVVVKQNLLIIQMLKQRGDIGNYIWFMMFKPEYLQLFEMELSNVSEDL